MKGAKLTGDQVREIRELRAEDVDAGEIAEAFGVHATYISAICTGRARLDAGGPITRFRSRRKDRNRRRKPSAPKPPKASPKPRGSVSRLEQLARILGESAEALLDRLVTIEEERIRGLIAGGSR